MRYSAITFPYCCCRINVPRLSLIVLLFNLLLSCVIAKNLSVHEMDLIVQAASLSNRVYRWDDIGFDTSFETYYESDDKIDAVVVAVYPNDKCIIAFRGTKPMKENVANGEILADITLAGIIDFLTNLAFQKEKVHSKTNDSKSCTVGQPMLQSYYKLLDVLEDQIDADCVSHGLPLIFTGHSQGAALAQLAAVRYEQQQPRVINFGPMATFFYNNNNDDNGESDDEKCPIVPNERIINFVNTETDQDSRRVLQFDIVPFLDVFINKYFASNSFWSFLLPENVYNTIVDAQSSNSQLSTFFIGTFKGEFYILNPNDLPSLAYVPRRNDILLDGTGEDDYSIIDIDLLDLDEMFNFSSTTYGQRFASAHEMNNYKRKLEQLQQQLLHDNTNNPDQDDIVVVANGFESFTSCNPNAGWKQCVGFCEAENAFMCSTGMQGEPCFDSNDCIDDDLSCTWTVLEGTLFQFVWRCL